MRIARILSLLVPALLAAAACARITDVLVPGGSVNVVGDWVATYPANDGAHTEERMKFGEDGAFRSEVLWIGFYALPADEVTGYMRSEGRYRVEGDRLMVAITRSETWQKYAVGPNPSVATPAPAWGDHGRVAVDGDRLTRTYVSAPADAPQTFTAVYHRER